MRKQPLFLIPLLILSVSLMAQNKNYPYLMTADSSVSLAEVQQAFETSWSGKDRTVKGKGWKAFKRFEYQHRDQLLPNGQMANGYNNFFEYQKYMGPANSGAAGQKLNQGNQLMAAGNWSYIGPANGISTNGGAGRTNFVRFDPTNSSIMYAGTPAGGLWKSTNGGTSWTVLADNMASLGCTDLAIDPTNTNVMYLATGDADGKDTYSTGVLKSTDGGITWNTTGLLYTIQSNKTIFRLLINPNNPQELWAATSSGLMKTMDGGVNWFTAKTGGYNDMEFNPANPNTLYIIGGSAFYVTRNGGISWTLVPLNFTGSVGRSALAVTPADTSYIYVLAGIPNAGNADDNGFRGISRSIDGGQTFTVMSTSPNVMGWSSTGGDQGGQAWYDIAIACSPTNKNTIFTGGVNIWKSTNGGTTMTNSTVWYGGGTTYVHADIHGLEFLPGSATTVYAACDGGVFRTTNTGTAWSDLSSGLQIAQQYNIGVSQTNSALNITGWQDNGTNLQNGTACGEVLGGDGFECIISHASASVMYGELYYGDISKSTNGGTSFNNIVSSGGTGVDEDGDWNTPYIQHPTTANTLLVGKKQVYRSTNAGTSWTQLGSVGGSTNLRRLAYAPSNPNYIYATTGSGLWVSTNGGTSFTDRSSALPSSVTYMAVDPANPANVWISSGGYLAGNKVYVTTDAGQTWQNWSAGLPNVPCNTIVYQSGSNDGLYVGTDIGVFYRDSSMTQWIAFSDNLPNVKVSELEIQVSAGKLRASTYGRGMWETDLYSPPVSAPVCSFSSNMTGACINAAIDFYDQSTNLPFTWNWTFQGGTPASSTLQYPSASWASPGTYNVKLVVTNQAGTDSSVMNGYVTIYPNPVAVVSNDTTICKGDTIQIYASGGISYSWTTGNTISNPFVSNPLVFPSAYKYYSVTVGDANGCKATDGVGVTVILPFTNPSISASGSTLTASPSGAQYAYQWFIDGTPISGATSSTLLADSSGSYSVQVSDTTGCFTLTSAGLAFVGMQELNNLAGWGFYPNPVRDLLNISPAKEFNGEVILSIFDATGKLIQSERRTLKNGQVLQMKAPAASGVYFLRVTDNSGEDFGSTRFMVIKE